LKKWLNILLLTILAIGLTACNDTAEPVDEADAEEDVEEEATADEENEEVDEEEDESGSELTPQEVYEESLKAAESLESASVTMNIEQEITSPDGVENLSSTTEGEVEMTVDPLTMYQSMTIKGEAEDEQMESIVEMYITEEAFYIYEEEIDEWIKVDTTMMGDISELADQGDPSEQLKQIEQFASEFEIEENEDEFILKINADGDDYTAMMEQMAGDIMPPELSAEMEAEGIDIFEQMTINLMNYELYLDKETFDLLNFKMEMDMDMDVDGETGNITSLIEATYSNINELDPVEVPEEVEEAAIDESEL